MFSLFVFFTAAAPYCTDARIPVECRMELANIAILEQFKNPGRDLDTYLEVASEEADPGLWP